MKTLYIYMMSDVSRSVLYVGVTNSLVRRVSQHQRGEIKGFTEKYQLNRLVYFESYDHPHDAISREEQLEGWTRAKRSELVLTKNPKWADPSWTLDQPARGPSPSARLRMTCLENEENK